MGNTVLSLQWMGRPGSDSKICNICLPAQSIMPLLEPWNHPRTQSEPTNSRVLGEWAIVLPHPGTIEPRHELIWCLPNPSDLN